MIEQNLLHWLSFHARRKTINTSEKSSCEKTFTDSLHLPSLLQCRILSYWCRSHILHRWWLHQRLEIAVTNSTKTWGSMCPPATGFRKMTWWYCPNTPSTKPISVFKFCVFSVLGHCISACSQKEHIKNFEGTEDTKVPSRVTLGEKGHHTEMPSPICTNILGLSSQEELPTKCSS